MIIMPNMDDVISDVVSDIQGNAPTTGQDVIDRTGYKRHQVKQAIGRKSEDLTISAPTEVFITMDFRIDGQNSKLNLASNTIYATRILTVKAITNVMIQVESADGNVRVKIYDDNNGSPNNLLGESNSTPALNGLMTIPCSATGNGLIWVGVETDSTDLVIRSILETGKSVSHVFGTESDPFGTPVDVDNTPFIGIVTTENKVPRWYDADWS